MKVRADRAPRRAASSSRRCTATRAASSSRPTTRSKLPRRPASRAPFVQDNHSRSARGTLRGLHAQLAQPQGKLVRVRRRRDLRRRGRHAARLAARSAAGSASCSRRENFRQLYVPPGFAHGFCVTRASRPRSSTSAPRSTNPATRSPCAGTTPRSASRGRSASRMLSAKDAAAPLLAEIIDRLPAYRRLNRRAVAARISVALHPGRSAAWINGGTFRWNVRSARRPWCTWAISVGPATTAATLRRRSTAAHARRSTKRRS